MGTIVENVVEGLCGQCRCLCRERIPTALRDLMRPSPTERGATGSSFGFDEMKESVA